MDNINIKVKFFGGFRRYGDEKKLVLPVGEGLEALRLELAKILKADHEDFRDELLIQDSAFANDKTILPHDFIFAKDAEIAILPPVCGG